MGKTNVIDKPLPAKIEKRLADLVGMGEFGQDDVAHCRRTYWTAREDWHQILIDCYEMAKTRAPTVLFKPAPAGQVSERRAFLAKHQTEEAV